MKILFPDMHSRMANSMAHAVEGWGELWLPNNENLFQTMIPYGRKWTQHEIHREIGLDHVKSIALEDMYENPPDVLIVSCYEVEKDVLFLHKKLESVTGKKVKLVHFAGNVDVPYVDEKVINAISPDVTTLIRLQDNGKNVIQYFPWIDFDHFRYQGSSNTAVIGTYIFDYAKLFPKSYALYDDLTTNDPMLKNKGGNRIYVLCDNHSKDIVWNMMGDTSCTLHIKDLEGYGFSVIESLAMGRPVFLYRPFTKNRILTYWAINGGSAIYFDTKEEYYTLMNMFMTDVGYRHRMQENAAKIVRKVINNEEQSNNLRKFMENLR